MNNLRRRIWWWFPGDGQTSGGTFKSVLRYRHTLEVYRNFPQIGGIVHTHSEWANVFSQIGVGSPPSAQPMLDFYGEIPCTRPMRPEEIQGS